MNFLPEDEIATTETFLATGRLKLPVDDRALLDQIQQRTAELVAEHLHSATPDNAKAFLDGIHEHVDAMALNELRLSVIEGLNREPWLRPAYFTLARRALEQLVGNELCMQRRINLSVQLPDDDSSLLATHADVWSGDSAFEVVVWLPLVDCFGTKAMYLCPPDRDRKVQSELARFNTAEDIFNAIEKDVEWLTVPYGEVLVFDQSLMHGNRINDEKETRWSMNCRFKSVSSPYVDKKIGEFFEPITLKPMTRRGMTYKLPGGYQ
jgi:sporadic carbohydrate cluster 2OG-Fe(II) oxygenase